MPSPDATHTDAPRKRPDPSVTPAEDLILALRADPAKGLSPREAERRHAQSTAGSLFVKSPRSMADCLKQVAREPAFWMLLAVSVISLFFGRFFLGACCALLTAGNGVLCAFFLRRTDRTEAAMAAYDAPLCRVLRGRRVLRLGADALVEGDILLLCAGDIIPADCRLLRADGLTVLERELDASDPTRAPLRLRKRATDTPKAGAHRVSPENMVYGGGIVEAGEALALVCAVGSDTHLGGLTGGLPSALRGRLPSDLTRAARVLSVFNLGLFCFLVPLTAIGIFTLGDRYEFLDIFLSAAALATLTLTEHILAKAYYLSAAARRAAARDRDRQSTADIRSSAVCERLTAMTDLLLVGTAALHDGLDHPEILRMGDTVYYLSNPEADDEIRAVAEYLYIYRTAVSTLPTAGYEENRLCRLIPLFCDWAEIVPDSLMTRVKDIRPEREGVTALWNTSDGSRRIRIHFTERFKEAETCDILYDPAGTVPLDTDRRNSLYRAWREAVRQGFGMAFVILEENGKRVLRAAITYATLVDHRTAGCIRGLERGGIRVAAFLRDESDRHTRALAACGLTENAPADRPIPHTPRVTAVQRLEQGVRAFVGCEEDYILQCIRDLKAEGRTVGILSVEGEDLSLLAEADIAFTCTPTLYISAEGGIPRIPVLELSERDSDPDGLPDGRIATDRARRSAHVLVRRSEARGGGVLGVRRAILAADACRDTQNRGLRALLLSQTVRILMAVVPLCLGLSIAAAPVLLLSGLGLDLLFLVTYSRLPLRDIPAPRRKRAPDLHSLWVTHRAELISVAAGAVLPWIAVGIASLAGVSFGGDLLYFGLLCTVGLQTAVFRVDSLPRRDRSVFFATLILGLTYAGSLAASLAAGLGLIWAVPVPLAAPALYLSTRAILSRVLNRKPGSKPGSKPGK